MPDLSFLQYVANPFSLIAVTAGVLGMSFRILLKKFETPRPGFILAMYGMFIAAILALALGGIAIILLLSGTGATDEVAFKKHYNTGFIPTTYAQDHHEEILSSQSAILNPQSKIVSGWIWAGEVESLLWKEEKGMTSSTLFASKIPHSQEKVITKTKTNLRELPPEFQWFFFRYKLGNLIRTLPAEQELKVMGKKYAGFQLWLQVEILEKDIQKEDRNTEAKTPSTLDFEPTNE